MIKKYKAALLAALLLPAVSLAAEAAIFNGTTGRKTTLNKVMQSLRPGQVVIVSESHGHPQHHQNQRDFLKKTAGLPFSVSVGMEFFSYPNQPHVDAYVSGVLPEAEFLKEVDWGTLGFEHYRFQVQFPATKGGQTVALNLPRAISSKVSRSGLASLTAEEQALLPPQFVLGGDLYFERFSEVMHEHVDPQELQNYFVAQCLWDETMAWRAVEYLRAHPGQLLVIIVGDFHVAYEDGLVARLRDQGIDTVVVSQVTDLNDVATHPRYGRRADFVWLSR